MNVLPIELRAADDAIDGVEQSRFGGIARGG